MFFPILLILQLSIGKVILAQYAPTPTPCPSNFSLIRQTSTSNGSLNRQENQFISRKTNKVLSKSIQSYLKNLQNYTSTHAPNTTLPSYLIPSNSTLIPKIGLSVSGGGYRAAIFGLSVFHTFDARNTSLNSGLNGILQSALYMSGLSGGSWALGSLAQANFPTIPTIFFGPPSPPPSGNGGRNGEWGGWNSPIDILPADPSFILSLLSPIHAKSLQFPISFTDLWALGLARHFMNGTTAQNYFDDGVHGTSVLFSEVADLPAARSGLMPFPIFTLDSRDQDTTNNQNPFVPLNNTLFEVTPYEFGSWDPNLSSFTPTKFLGSKNTSTCLIGFERLSFIIGTSSDLFNEYNTTGSLSSSSIAPAISLLNATFLSNATSGSLQTQVELDASIWPNPFKGQNFSTFPRSSQEVLTLVDGGEDGQVIPLAPLAVKARGLDVIIAIDASNDDEGFARGASLVASANRTTSDPSKSSIYNLPPLPTSTTPFIPTDQGGLGLATRPTFFGCGNFTSETGGNVSAGGGSTPLLIYIPNGAPPPGQAPLTNTSTSQTVYTTDQLEGFFNQAIEIATQGFSGDGNSTKDPDYPICLACAIFEPSRARSTSPKIPRDQICETCFTRYCWNGSYPTIGGFNGTGNGNETGSGNTGAAISSRMRGEISVVLLVWMSGLVGVLTGLVL